jgi:hypothetical protein
MPGPDIIVICQCGNRARINGRCRDCHRYWEQLNPKTTHPTPSEKAK